MLSTCTSSRREDTKSLSWRSIWAGDWVPAECSDWGEYYVSFPREDGLPFVERAIFSFERGKVTAWLPEQEVAAYESRMTSRYPDESSVRDLAAGMRLGSDAALAFMAEHEKDDLSEGLFRGYLEAIRGYYKYSISVKYFLDGQAPDKAERFLPLLEPARLYGEPVFTRSVAFMRGVAAKASVRYGIPADEVLYLTRDEFLELVAGEHTPPVSILTSRRASSVLCFRRGEEAVFVSGDEARETRDALAPSGVFSGSVLGSIAFAGKARGVARIILDPARQQFRDGEVLVTGMTRPEYLPLFRRAAAVVTDAGGVLSHAAITARELKKPCVIGTKIATQVLKDGDLVEVDAERGVVHVLKSV